MKSDIDIEAFDARSFNAGVGETLRRLTITAMVIGAVLFAAAYASSAVAGPVTGLAEASAPASTVTVGGTLEQVAKRPKIISIRRARFIDPDEGISPASCWVTYAKWGVVFYQSCPF